MKAVLFCLLLSVAHAAPPVHQHDSNEVQNTDTTSLWNSARVRTQNGKGVRRANWQPIDGTGALLVVLSGSGLLVWLGSRRSRRRDDV